MLNRMCDGDGAWTNMYVTGCHSQYFSITSWGERPSHPTSVGKMSVAKYVMTLAHRRKRTAGVTGPGPKVWAIVERRGLRGITPSPARYRTTLVPRSVPARAGNPIETAAAASGMN